MPRLAFLATSLLATTPALAETPPTGIPAAPDLAGRVEPAPRVALAINAPFAWALERPSFGASVYVRTVGDNAIRINAARYAGHMLDLGEASHDGATTDLGVGWVTYSRAAFSGLMLEVGALYRRTNETAIGAFSDGTDTATSMLGGRALVGYSLRLHRHFFIAAAAGVSVGIERGTETTYQTDASDMMRTTTQVDRAAFAPEAYLRFGVPL